MSNQFGRDPAPPGYGNSGSCLLWLLGGLTLGFTTILSLVLLLLLAVSVAVNFYLAWRLTGLEIVVSRPAPASPEMIVVTATPAPLVQVEATAAPAAAITATPLPPAAQVTSQLATVAAIATQAAEPNGGAAFAPPAGTIVAESMGPAPAPPATPGGIVPAATATPPPAQAAAATATPPPAQAAAAVVSSNSYDLIPIEGERESRPAEKHGDLNLKLRDPQPSQAAPELVDIANAGSDSNAPKLGAVFKPDFAATYTVHNWDFATCDCKGELIQDEGVVLVGIKTTPGEPIYIPPVKSDIFGGKHYATVLYASEDSLTFVYNRAGNVAKGYSIHYLGLQTDPNLVALFRQSQGSQLPGLTKETPVGVATGELIVAVRDNGTFMDARSRKDWWD